MRIFIIILCLVYNGAFAQEKVTFAQAKIKADQGDPKAQYRLGWSYRSGDGVGPGVKPNYLESAKYFQMSADQGYGKAQGELAECYVDGRGVERDLIKAYAYYSLALLSFEGDSAVGARRRRAEIAEGMTFSQIQTAKELAVSLQAEIVARAKAEKK